MLKAYGPSWSLNANGVVDLLTRPGTFVAVDVETLERVIRSSVAEAVASFEPASTDEQVVYSPPVEAWEEPAPSATESPVEESFVAPPRDTSIFAEAIGNGAPPTQPVQPARVQPATTADEKRRQFVRSFLAEERAARGLGSPTR
jgi:hypothetical protein